MLVNNNSIEGWYTESCRFKSRRGSFFDFPLIIIYEDQHIFSLEYICAIDLWFKRLITALQDFNVV